MSRTYRSPQCLESSYRKAHVQSTRVSEYYAVYELKENGFNPTNRLVARANPKNTGNKNHPLPSTYAELPISAWWEYGKIVEKFYND